MDLDRYLGMNPEDYSDDDLRNLRDSFLEVYESYQEEWADELAEISKNPKFDQYSFFGKRKLEKFTDKYADKMATAEVLLEIIQEELDKRAGKIDKFGNVIEQDTDENMSENEFLRKEEEKTNRIREIISSKTDDIDE